MFKVRLAGGHLYGKQLFTWLSLVMSLTASICAVLFPTRCLGWDLGLNWLSFWGISYLLLPENTPFITRSLSISESKENTLLCLGSAVEISIVSKSRLEIPQKLTQLSPRSHPRHLVGKRTTQKTPSKTPPATARWTAVSHTGGHRLV